MMASCKEEQQRLQEIAQKLSTAGAKREYRLDL